MSETVSRKEFFRAAIFQTARFSADLIDAVCPIAASSSPSSGNPLEADFPPELLLEEALRLGIDPDNKEEVLAEIGKKLEKPDVSVGSS